MQAQTTQTAPAAALFVNPADAGPQPEVLIAEGRVSRTGGCDFYDMRRADWQDFIGQHPVMDAPDYVPIGGTYSARHTNWRCISGSISRNW